MAKAFQTTTLRALAALMLLTLTAGCYTGGPRHGSSSDSNGVLESSDSYRSTERDHGAGWEAERNSEGNSQGYTEDSH